MDVKEIDREIERLQKLREEAEREEARRKVIENHREAVEIYGRLIDDVRRLEEIGYLPPKLEEALRDKNGKFNPGMYIKKPRKPSDADAS